MFLLKFVSLSSKQLYKNIILFYHTFCINSIRILSKLLHLYFSCQTRFDTKNQVRKRGAGKMPFPCDTNKGFVCVCSLQEPTECATHRLRCISAPLLKQGISLGFVLLPYSLNLCPCFCVRKHICQNALYLLI